MCWTLHIFELTAFYGPQEHKRDGRDKNQTERD